MTAELVVFALFIASMTQNKFSSIFLKNAQLLPCEEWFSSFLN